MGVRYKVTCGECEQEVYSYNQYANNLSSVGLPIVTCQHCECDIKFGLEPLSHKDSSGRFNEKLKQVSLIVFESLSWGFVVSMILFVVSLPLGGFKILFEFFGCTETYQRLWVYIFLGVIPSSLGVYYFLYGKNKPYTSYYKWVEEEYEKGRRKVHMKEFVQRYPNWSHKGYCKELTGYKYSVRSRFRK